LLGFTCSCTPVFFVDHPDVLCSILTWRPLHQCRFQLSCCWARGIYNSWPFDIYSFCIFNFLWSWWLCVLQQHLPIHRLLALDSHPSVLCCSNSFSKIYIF
jgi:hypothetical protein